MESFQNRAWPCSGCCWSCRSAISGTTAWSWSVLGYAQSIMRLFWCQRTLCQPSTPAAFRNHVSCLSASTGRRPWNGGAVRWRQRAGSMPGGGSSKTRLRWTTRRGALLARDVPRTTQDKNAPLRTAHPRSTCPDFLAVLLSCTVFAVQLPTMVNCVKQNLAD